MRRTLREYGLEDADDYTLTTSGEIEQAVDEISPLSFGSIILSVLSMFFWTFGALPVVIDAVFVVFRIIFLYLLVDLLWIG